MGENLSLDPQREYRLSCRVDAYRSGWTLAEFLAHRFRYHPPEVWKERLASGAVSLNGDVATSECVVERDDRIEYRFLHAEPSVDFSYDVLHHDESLLVVSKSGNLPVHAGGKFIRNTLIARLRKDFEDDSLRPAHRLDRETSGIVVLAKGSDVARSLEVQFRERAVHKRYMAVVRGTFPESADVDAPIARKEPAEPPYFRVVEADRGKPARTRFLRRALLRTDAGEPASLVEVNPLDGRTNQIRVHAAHLGHPILGDKIYGVPPDVAREFVDEGETKRVLEVAGSRRHLLHCAQLTLIHPVSGSEVVWEASLPRDFLARIRPLSDREGGELA